MAYSIFLRPAAARNLDSLPSEARGRIEQAIDRLADNPRPRGSKKLTGFEDEWRLRVGEYRVLYVIDDGARRVTVARIAHRREAYR
jgi:mRNA interferase RelE/StbE